MWAALIALGLSLAGPAAPASSARTVLVGPAERTDDVQRSLEELLERDDAVRIEFEQAAAFDPGAVTRQPEGPLIARVWLDLRRDTEATIYIVDSSGERILIRRVPLESGLDEVGREQVAHIVATAIEVLAEGAVLGITRNEARLELGVETQAEAPAEGPAQTPPPPAEQAPAQGHRIGWAVGAGYQAQAWARPVPMQHGPLLWAELRATGKLAPGAGISVQYQPPIPLPDSEANAQVFSPRAAAMLSPRVAENLDLNVALGAGLDAYLSRPAPESGSAWTAIPMLHALAGIAAQIHPKVRLHAALVLDVDLVDTRFVVQSSGRVLLDPWRARPGLRLGVSFGRR